jgi:presenilin-like A22 family membrane protease
MERYQGLVTEIGMFLFTQVLAISVGFKMISGGGRDLISETTGGGVAFFSFGLMLSTICLLIILKFFNKQVFFQILFAGMVLIGSSRVFGLFLPPIFAEMIAIILVILRFYHPTIVMQNISMMLAIGGVGPSIAMLFGAKTIAIMLALVAVYDYVAVFKTKHMVKMFKGMLKHDVPFTFIIPEKGRHQDKIATKLVDNQGKRICYMLGSGDVAFPAVFAVALLADFGIFLMIASILGATCGLILDQIIVINYKKPIPAMPAISVGTLLFSGIAYLL